jgi:hypothetical protein
MFRNLAAAEFVLLSLMGVVVLGIAAIPTSIFYCSSPARKLDNTSSCYSQQFALTERCLQDPSDAACDLIQAQNLNVKVK